MGSKQYDKYCEEQYEEWIESGEADAMEAYEKELEATNDDAQYEIEKEKTWVCCDGEQSVDDRCPRCGDRH